MRVFMIIAMLMSLTACYHQDRGGRVHVDGVGEAQWGDSGHYKHKRKGCPPGLAKQGRC